MIHYNWFTEERKIWHLACCGVNCEIHQLNDNGKIEYGVFLDNDRDSYCVYSDLDRAKKHCESYVNYVRTGSFDIEERQK